MDRMVYVAMSGAKQIFTAQAALTHNLANVNTTGFRADLSQFRAMPVFGSGYPSRVYAMAERPAVDFAPGVIQTTGRDLDVAINGTGWLAVQAADGSEAYTRAGDLRVTSAGIVETGAGYPLLGNGGPIAIPPAEKIQIGADGTVGIRSLGQQASTLVALDRIKLVNPDVADLVKGDDGLFRRRDGLAADADADVRLTPGALEGSNVNAVQAMVDMIGLARQFELQVQLMKVAEEDDAAAQQLIRVG